MLRGRPHRWPTDWAALGLGLSLLAAVAVVTYGPAGRYDAATTDAD